MKRMRPGNLLLPVLFIQTYLIDILGGVQTGHSYWNTRYGGYGINHPQWNGFWYNSYKSIDVSRQTTSTCKIVRNVLRCATGFTTLNIFNEPNLKEIPHDGLPTNIVELTIRNTGLEKIDPQTFIGLKNLVKLTIIESQIKTVPDLSGCESLVELDLFSNQISIQRSNFSNLPPSLTRINLVENKIDKLPNGYFNLPKLEYLALSHNQMRYFPGNALGCKKLLYLGVDANKIKMIPSISLQNMMNNQSQLVHLNISNNEISYIEPKTLHMLTHLKILELHNNCFQNIPFETFWKIPELLHLDLIRNKIKVLSSRAVESCPKLVTLKIHSQQSGFKMTNVLFDSLKELKALKHLWLSNNALTNVPHGVLFEEKWDSLKELYLSDNQISSLSEYSINDFESGNFDMHRSRKKDFKPFSRNPVLSKIVIANNAITKIDVKDLEYCFTLTHLDVSGNRLQDNTIHEYAFQNTTLQKLYLRSQSIQYVPMVFKNNKSLPYINDISLSGNRITFVEKDAFVHLSTLATLDLQNNKIISVADGSFPPNIQTIYLSSNEFSFKNQHQFKDLEKLRTLILSSNKIDIIPREAFHGLKMLTNLQLQENKIGRILKIHFRDLESLSQVYLNGNEIAFIEDGTFASIKRDHVVNTISLHDNQLSRIPVSDFWNMKLVYLYLQNNRITKIPSQAFVNITNCYQIYLTKNKIERVESNGFQNLQCSYLYIGGNGNNVLQHLAPYAFNNIGIGQTFDLSYSFFEEIPENAFIVNTVNKMLLSNGKIVVIKERAFTITSNVELLDIQQNQIQVINKNIFSENSRVGILNLDNNMIRALHNEAFDGLTITKAIGLQNNKIAVFPARPFQRFTTLETLDLSNNEIQTLPANALRPFTSMKKLDLDNNKISKLPYGVFRTNINMATLHIENNQIQTIESGAFIFDGESPLQTIFLSGNDIDRLPSLGFLPKLRQIFLKGVKTIARDSIASLPVLQIMIMYSFKMQCDCHLFDALYTFLKKDAANNVQIAICSSPSSLENFSVTSATTMKARSKEFICSPTQLNISAPSHYTIQIKYKPSLSAFPFVDFNSTTYDNSSERGFNRTYHAVCQTEGYPIIQGSVINNDTIVISGSTTVLPGRDYSCHMYTVVSGNGSTWTSANTYSVSVTTNEEQAKATYCSNGDPYECVSLSGAHNPCKFGCDVNASNALQNNACNEMGCCKWCYQTCIQCNTSGILERIEIPITYYDFEATDPDFDNVKYTADMFDNTPYYIFSPFGSWLAISPFPTGDSFSNWFRGTASNNKELPSTMTLLSNGQLDPDNGNRKIYKYWSNSYWPVNGKGYQAQGQKDCATKALQNQGFTSSVRSVFTYRGTEHLMFAGGEELWVFVNGIMVIQILHDPSVPSIPCKSVALHSGEVIPKGGYVINGECVANQSLPNEKFSLNLKQGYRYSLDIFHTERFACNSQFLFYESGVELVSLTEQRGDKPRIDFYFEPHEDVHVTSIIGEIIIADPFTTGSTEIEITSGNEEDRFNIKGNLSVVYNSVTSLNDTTASPNDFTVDLNGETIVLCKTSAVSVPDIPKTRSQPQTFPSISSTTALLVLLNRLEYEATRTYLLRMVVRDTSSNLVGNLTVQINIKDINDHCPIILDASPSFYFQPDPVLQINPLKIITATDLDSGANGQISYKVSGVKELVPTIVARSYQGIDNEIIWVNETTEYFVSVQVFALDNGTPRRGDYVTFNVTYRVSCHAFARIRVNESDGGIHLEAPGMVVSNNSKDCSGCKAGFYCPGNSQELRCGFDDATRYMYSFGLAAKCTTCPQGWLCHKGLVEKCPADTYVTCNDSFCPIECTPCPPGTYCFEGKMYDCKPGTYSDGSGRCKLCEPGSFNTEYRESSCQCCPAGYYSTYMKTGCEPCPSNEFSLGNCDQCKTCPVGTDCGCSVSPCSPGVICRNIGLGGYKCEGCLPGYTNNTEGKCVDVNECDENPCFSECINLVPGYRCTGCPPGFLGTAPGGFGAEFARSNKQNCTDVNECLLKDNACDENSFCINTQGDYYCGTCKPGYVGSGNGTCRLGDYCVIGLHNCHSNATCIPITAGKFICKCKDGYAGDGTACGVDEDYDGVSSYGVPCSSKACKIDNCPNSSNSGQEDFDDDTLGDVCDNDDDNDNFPDILDNCPFRSGRNQEDSDGDGIGDLCDNCVNQKNTDQKDTDADGKGDVCDDDIDNDGKLNGVDNCAYVSNADQADGDGDGIGDACDSCLGTVSTTIDSNFNGYADACDSPNNDKDGDSVINAFDNCVDVPNADQSDVDNDGKGDVCDNDSDNDGIADEIDNCIFVQNSNQEHKLLGYDLSSNSIGDACLDDFDGDGVADESDDCPRLKSVSSTSFKDHTLVDLASTSSSAQFPKWSVRDKGRHVEQNVSTFRPSLLVGKQRYGEMEFSGTFFVNEQGGNVGHYIGFVFAYQNNQQFYLVSWRQDNRNYLNTTYKAGIASVQIKKINSTTGRSNDFEYALWHSEDSVGQADLLWMDPKLQGWKPHTAYIFRLNFRPSLGRIRLQIKRGQELISDSGYIYDNSYSGGRIGLYSFGQGNIVWSNLNIQCIERVNHALQFDGTTSVQLPTIEKLKLTSSFTITAWMKLPSVQSSSSSKLPLICDKTGFVCIYVFNGMVFGMRDLRTVSDNFALPSNSWTFVSLRYDAQAYELELFINGTSQAKTSNILPSSTGLSNHLFIGKDGGSNFFSGILDEVAIWNVYIANEDIRKYMTTSGLLWPKHQQILSAHYHMDEAGAPTLLGDDSGHGNDGTITNGKWIESYVDRVQFQFEFPYNRRRRDVTLHEEL